ncbi:hypothetical protein D3227_11945 [Mesorhizobium waimense]|uniref:Uncharacterized protein n=1 Tax=Mesorhizobium waimense TaxID=1300307 RepID=A0A3A5L2F0_9HYPH|nr:hypothetical protein [Mesorhizobium waimense]RJT40078.1 hypothetical protein D3227_11945 [Mesorhizobium waimense]
MPQGSINRAVGGVLGEIAPQHPQPSTLGPSAAEANVINKTRQDINAQVRPLYEAAERQTVPDSQFAQIAADPRYAAGVERLRANPELAPDHTTSPVGSAGRVVPQPLPPNTVKVIDAVTKDLNARGESLATKSHPLYAPSSPARARSPQLTPVASPARPRQSTPKLSPSKKRFVRIVLSPIEQGPVGRVAAAGDTTAAGNAILPANLLAGPLARPEKRRDG